MLRLQRVLITPPPLQTPDHTHGIDLRRVRNRATVKRRLQLWEGIGSLRHIEAVVSVWHVRSPSSTPVKSHAPTLRPRSVLRLASLHGTLGPTGSVMTKRQDVGEAPSATPGTTWTLSRRRIPGGVCVQTPDQEHYGLI